MKKARLVRLCLVFVTISLILACVFTADTRFAPGDVVDNIDRHTCAIATFFYMEEAEYQQRMKLRTTQPQWDNMPGEALKFWDRIIPINAQQAIDGIPMHSVAYIGAGTMLRDNYIITVSHLFNHTDKTMLMKCWVFFDWMDRAVEAELVAVSENKDMSDDYAVIKLKEDLGLPGLRIAAPDALQKGDPVIYSGSVGGCAFFTRYGYVTTFQKFLRRDKADGRLHLSYWNDFKFWCIYPSGPGDSGGSIKNIRGEVVTIMYCGVAVYKEQYVFGNPTQMLIDFLNKHNLGWLQ